MTNRGAARARRHAWWRLLIVAGVAAVASCRGAARTAPAAGAPAVTPVTPPPVAPVAPLDSAALRADSVRRDSLAAAAADSASRRATALRDSVTRDSLAKDSVSKAKAKAARKPKTAARECVLDFAESPPETRLLYSRMSDSTSNTFIGGGFVGRCQGENNRLRADSAEQFQQAGIVNLYGNVTYEEYGKMQVAAAHAVYFTREGRLYADGNVVATQLSTGSTFTGPSIEYFRAMPDRPVARMVAPNRSTARLIEKDSLGRPGPPVTVIANRFEDTGDSLLMAWGDVVIERQQINGRSDSSAFDKITQRARLVRGARITNTDSAQRFVLTADTIDLFSTDRKLDRVFASHKATATNEQLVLTSELIDLRLKEQQLDEAFAFGPGRSRATTSQQDVEADSLRIRLAERRVREVRAVGDARAVGSPDSTKIRTPDKDVLSGDSVFAFFDSTATADTTQGPRIREIRALGNASSLFHIANSRGPTAPPGINYVRGVRIYVNFDTGAVRDVRVDSAASGVYLEPVLDSLSDTTARRSSAPGGQPRPGSPPPPTAGSTPVRRPPPVPDPSEVPAPVPPGSTYLSSLSEHRRRS